MQVDYVRTTEAAEKHLQRTLIDYRLIHPSFLRFHWKYLLDVSVAIVKQKSNLHLVMAIHMQSWKLYSITF